MKTVFASIVGDLFHVGHLNLLCQAKQMGRLVVGVLSDEVVESYKRKPIIPQEERFIIVSNIKGVSLAFLQMELEPNHDFLREHIDIIVHGDDWKDNFPGAEYMRSIGKEAINLPYFQAQSTTKIIEKIKKEY